jgi:uncharacterized damage-inducible protein DinB
MRNMDAAAQAQLTVGGFLPWVSMILDYTDEIVALIPEDKLDRRMEDPSGAFCFSLGEIAMHMADARRMFARELSGAQSEEGYWSDGPAEGGVWKFKPCESKQALLDSLAAARAELAPYTELSATSYTETTQGTRGSFERMLAAMREHGKDTAQAESRGPANIVRVLMAVVAHESGHRGSLQTLLRQQGINAKRDEG